MHISRYIHIYKYWLNIVMIIIIISTHSSFYRKTYITHELDTPKGKNKATAFFQDPNAPVTSSGLATSHQKRHAFLPSAKVAWPLVASIGHPGWVFWEQSQEIPPNGGRVPYIYMCIYTYIIHVHCIQIAIKWQQKYLGMRKWNKQFVCVCKYLRFMILS